jgi:hypothetical protein
MKEADIAGGGKGTLQRLPKQLQSGGRYGAIRHNRTMKVVDMTGGQRATFASV